MKKLIGFLVVAGLLGGYIYFFDNSLLDFKKQEEEQSQLLYDTFKAKHPHHIIIKTSEGEVDLKRPWQGKWTVTNAGNYSADEDVIGKMMETVLTIKKDNLISNNPQNWDKFDVTSEKGIEVIIKEREDREIAHFWVGKMGTSFENQYFRKNNLDEVYLVNQNLSVHFTRPLEAWKDRTILKLDQDKIQSVKVADNYALVRSGSGWTMNDEDIAQEKVDVILGAIADLKTTEFPTEEVQVNSETADYTVIVELMPSPSSSENPLNKFYLKQVEEGEDFYLMLEGNPTLFKVTGVKKGEIVPEIEEENMGEITITE